MIPDLGAVVEVSKFLMGTGRLLGAHIVATEQYPERLGATVKDLQPELAGGGPAESPTAGGPALVAPKREFTMVVGDVAKFFDDHPGVSTAVLFGLETHICVLQTAQDLLRRGKRVIVVADGVCSIRDFDRTVALRRMERMGVQLATAESVVFELMGTSLHPRFRAVSGLVKARGEAARGNPFAHL